MSKQTEYELGAEIVREAVAVLSDVAIPEIASVAVERGAYTTTQRVSVRLPGGREIRIAIQDEKS
jgi:hypothetical protein